MFLVHLLIKLLLTCYNDTKDAFELCKQKYEQKKVFHKGLSLCSASICCTSATRLLVLTFSVLKIIFLKENTSLYLAHF